MSATIAIARAAKCSVLMIVTEEFEGIPPGQIEMSGLRFVIATHSKELCGNLRRKGFDECPQGSPSTRAQPVPES
jgi:hypothetical protein